MKSIASILIHEVTERRRMLLVALLVGLGAPLLARAVVAELSIVALVLAIAMGHGVALLVGASVLNGPLREGRIGFFFNRPVSASSIWWGKFLGAVVLALLVQLVVFLPGLVWALLRGDGVADETTVLLASAAGLFGSTLLGHLLGTMITDRSKLILLDVAALFTVGLIAFGAWRPVRDFGAENAQFWLLAGLSGAVFLGALVGSWRQLRSGRVSVVRGHRALSTTVWSVTLVAALASFGFSRWTVTLAPDEMTAVGVEAGSGSGSFVLRSLRLGSEIDPRRGVEGLFLVDAESGRWQRLPGSPGRLPAGLSADGSRLLWATESGRGERYSLGGRIAEVEPDGTLRDLVQLPVDELTGLRTWQLSPDGDRVADLAFREDPARPEVLSARVRVWQLPTGRVEMEQWLELPLPARTWRPGARFFWSQEHGLRLFLEQPEELVLWRLGGIGGASELVQVAAVPGGAVRYGPGGERVLVSAVAEDAVEPGGYRLFDHQLRELWSLPALDGSITSWQLLGDFVLVDSLRQDSERWVWGLMVGGRDGWSAQRRGFGCFGSSVFVGGTPRALVTRTLPSKDGSFGYSRQTKVVLDLESGAVEEVSAELVEAIAGRVPLSRLHWTGDLYLGRSWEAGGPGQPGPDRLFVTAPESDERPSIVEVDWQREAAKPFLR